MKKNHKEVIIFLWPDTEKKKIRLVTVINGDLASSISYSTGATLQKNFLLLEKKLRKRGYKIIYEDPFKGHSAKLLNALLSP